MMMFALPAIWLYSCWSHTAGANSVTVMFGWPPPEQSAASHVSKAVFISVSVSLNVMFRFGEAPTCTEKLTHDCGQAMGMPQSSGFGGSHTAAVWGLPSLQLDVRQ